MKLIFQAALQPMRPPSPAVPRWWMVTRAASARAGVVRG